MSSRARRSPRRTGNRVLSWLSQGFERILPQPEGMKKPEVSAAQLGKTGGYRVEMRVGRAPCIHPPAHPSWDLGEENPKGIQQSKKRPLCAVQVFPNPDAERMNAGSISFGTDLLVSGLNGCCRGCGAETTAGGVWG